MNNRAKVLAVQLPAPCPLACDFCRTPRHAEGNVDAVFERVVAELPRYEELYLTSNGETGLSTIFKKLVDASQNLGIKVSVLCATERSVVPGLSRVEVSLNEYTRPLALRAIEKARSLDIPVVVSMVDDGKSDAIDLESVAKANGADGVMMRALRMEGRSGNERGSTRIYRKPGSEMGFFPVPAYAELVGHGETPVCVDHFGCVVSLLGSPA